MIVIGKLAALQARLAEIRAEATYLRAELASNRLSHAARWGVERFDDEEEETSP